MNKFLYFPVRKDGKWLKDSRGKVRLYKSILSLVRACKYREYDYIQVFAQDDILSRKECESGCERWIKN